MSITVTNRLFGTHPIVLHAPGPLHADWRRATAEALTEVPPVDCRDVTVIIFDGPDRPDKPNGIAKRSLDRLGVPAMVMRDDRQSWYYRDKFPMILEALQSITTPYTMGVDSGDVIFIDSPQIAVDRFRERFACDLLFMSTGSRCWPELPQFVDYAVSRPEAATAQGRHWPNTGTFIAKTEFCQGYFEALRDHPYVIPWNTDQCAMMDAWPSWYPQVQLDYQCEIFQWFNEDRRVMRLERWTAPRQIALAKWLERFDGNMVGAEIGVFDGHTSEFLLRRFPQLRLWMVDQWKPYPVDWPGYTQADWDGLKECAEWWTVFAEDRRHVLRDPSTIAANYFADESLDFVFVDADHRYEQVKADLEAYRRKVRRGGIYTGHDYDAAHPGVIQAVNEFAADRSIDLGADSTWCIQN